LFRPVRALSFISILDRIHTDIILGEDLIGLRFADCVFDANNDAPLLMRRPAAVITAISTGDLERELAILLPLLNP
jgi:hypothetical protein